MDRFMKGIKNEKGITLVALVVTIVILIILAGITIASLTGDNGLLGKVGEAKEQTDLAGIREEVALIWNEVQMEIAGKGYNNKEIAEIFEEKLKENDPDASVTYQSSNNTFEVDYKDHMFEVQPSGELTSNREEVIKDIEDAWENVDKDQSDEDIAADLEEELQNKDENSTAEYNPETGNTDVNHGGYEAEVDEDGNVTIKGPEKDPNIDIDTDGDGEPDINIDTDGDGDPDINIDTDDDKDPDVNIDTDGDGEPDINIDEDGDLVPDVDIDENEDKIPDKNVTKLTIVGQPQAIETISNASDVSFNVQVTGAASAGSIKEEKITYQWYYNTINSNEGGTPIENANSSTYTIGKDNVTPSISGRYYYCVVTQEYRGKTNVETTNAASLTVISPVEITSNPTSVQAVEGANDVTFTVEASGNGDISYQWYYKTSSEGAETQVIGATSSTYTIEKEEVTTELNGRYYYAKVIQSYGTAVATATSSEGLLTVAERANIIQEPSSTTVTEGKDAKFTVAAIGVGDISYQWYKSNTNETNGTEIAGETEETLTIDNVTAEDNDTYYYVVITQKYGTSTVEITSNVARLTVGDRVSVSTPNDVNVIEGITDVTFSVEANGSGTFSYQWYKNTTDSNEGGTPIDTATGNSYTIRKEDVTIDLNNTYYYVEVTQNFGGNTNTVKSEPALLSVIAAATIGVQPNPVTAYEKGQNVIFNVETIGDGQLTYQWYKNDTNSNEGGEAIPSATGNSYTIEKEKVTQDLNNTYYYVEITQKYGSSTVTVKTEAAQLTVMGTGIEASETDVTVYVNGTAKTVTLSGENAGAFSIETPANETYATAEINQDNNNELIITPVGKGETSVVVKEGNGNKQTTVSITVSAGVSAPDIPGADYGAIVNGYDCTNSAAVNNWLLFYADDENIYLIADDYISKEYCPNGAKGSAIYVNGTNYKLSMNNVIRDYNGSASITNPDIKALNNDYFTKNYSSTYSNNMRSVAYMLDTNAWSGFAGEKAEYAVGGPSIEMLMTSYSNKYGVDYRAQASSETGYQISTNGGKIWKFYMSSSSEYLKSSDRTYVISETSKANVMWIASPSANDQKHLMGVNDGGYIGCYNYSNAANGFRPLVCLKSDTQLEKNSDGSYTIVEPPKNNNIKPSDYGATVKGYTCTNSAAVNNWLLFYADTENTYLIADDYILYDYVPTNSRGHKPIDRTDYQIMNFSNILNDYRGSASITDERIKALNSDYFTKGYTSTENNMKEVAYMLDIDAWKVYAGEKADYAVGGPSLELLFKSYNEKYGTSYVAEAPNSTGYLFDLDLKLNKDDPLYVIASSGKTQGMWLSSPSGYYSMNMIFVNYGGYIYDNTNYYPPGFRPIVCLKSDTKLVKNSDGSFTII